MFRKAIIFLAALLLLTACVPNANTGTIIDWVDFVKVKGKQYEGMYEAAIADASFVGKQYAEVTFTVSDNVTDPSYKNKNGDAAFLKEGTVLYEVKGMPEYLAVRDNSEINGYKLYQSKPADDKWNCSNMPNDINKIEIYKADIHPVKMQALTQKNQIDALLRLLKKSKPQPDGDGSNSDEDAVRFSLVMHTDAPIAHKCDVDFQDGKWYWYPDDMNILPDEIGEIILGK